MDIHVLGEWMETCDCTVSGPSQSILPTGGAAGMVSKITGSVGKGLAAITMDKEYQQERREEMNRPPKDFKDSLAKGGKGLLKVCMDFVHVFA